MWRLLHDAWWRLATQGQPQSFSDALASCVLQAGSLAYGAAVALRNTAYDRGWVTPARLPCRVISVGNITVGGTGKTTCVELIAQKLIAQGRRVAVLSRGYGGTQRDYALQWDGTQLWLDGRAVTGTDGLADEPQLLARHVAGLPILVGPRRDQTGVRACREFGAEMAILDDGFQHRQLSRDCEIVLVHARMPLGGWRMLPRGPMREPLRALTRAHVILVTKADEALPTLGALSERLRAVNPQADIVTAAHEPARLVDVATGEIHPPQRLAGMRVGLLSSIGDPEGFDSTIRRLHGVVLWHDARPDHHWYEAADWAQVQQRVMGQRPEVVITTGKDWVRLQPVILNRASLAVPLWVLDVRMKLLSGEEQLDARLARLCAR